MKLLDNRCKLCIREDAGYYNEQYVLEKMTVTEIIAETALSKETVKRHFHLEEHHVNMMANAMARPTGESMIGGFGLQKNLVKMQMIINQLVNAPDVHRYVNQITALNKEIRASLFDVKKFEKLYGDIEQAQALQEHELLVSALISFITSRVPELLGDLEEFLAQSELDVPRLEARAS